MEPIKKPKRGIAAQGTALQLAILSASTAAYAAIILFAHLTEKAEAASIHGERLSELLKADLGATLTIVRVLQGVLSAVCSAAASRALLFLQWTLTERPEGLSYRSLLALSPSTPSLGIIRILFSTSSRPWARTRCVMRMLVVAFIWLSGVLLFFRTSLVTVFDTAESYDVTAGTGSFDGSFVNGFFDFLHDKASAYPFSIVPYSYYGIVWNLVTNPVYSTVVDPIYCKPIPGSLHCASYLLSGGLAMMTPWPEGFADHPLVFIKDVPAVQLEFEGRSGGTKFDKKECQILGANYSLISAELCVRQVGESSIRSGIFICANGTAECDTGEPRANLTTTLTFHTRQADLLVSRSNSSIFSISNLTEPRSVTGIDIDAYKSVLHWLLDFGGAAIPAPSSILETFFSTSEDLSNPFVDGVLLQVFRSILVFPVWLFNPNNVGNSHLNQKTISRDLPKQFYTRGSTVASYQKLKFDPLFLLIFVTLQGAVLLFLWALFLWAVFSARALPAISSYPQFDILFKTETELPLGARYFDIRAADDSEILDIIEGAKIKAIPGNEYSR